MRKLRPREVRKLAQHSTPRKWWTWGLTPFLCGFNHVLHGLFLFPLARSFFLHMSHGAEIITRASIRRSGNQNLRGRREIVLKQKTSNPSLFFPCCPCPWPLRCILMHLIVGEERKYVVLSTCLSIEVRKLHVIYMFFLIEL